MRKTEVKSVSDTFKKCNSFWTEASSLHFPMILPLSFLRIKKDAKAVKLKPVSSVTLPKQKKLTETS